MSLPQAGGSNSTSSVAVSTVKKFFRTTCTEPLLFRPFVTDVVVSTEYDPTYMQKHLFVISSLPFLWAETESLVKRLGISVHSP